VQEEVTCGQRLRRRVQLPQQQFCALLVGLRLGDSEDDQRRRPWQRCLRPNPTCLETQAFAPPPMLRREAGTRSVDAPAEQEEPPKVTEGVRLGQGRLRVQRLGGRLRRAHVEGCRRTGWWRKQPEETARSRCLATDLTRGIKGDHERCSWHEAHQESGLHLARPARAPRRSSTRSSELFRPGSQST
jgi:hypothetical protein